MKSAIVPISSVPPQQIIDYLTGEGIGRGLTANEVRWKYFDDEFSIGRPRGFAWLKADRVQGFIGCIPAIRATPAGDKGMIWTCDWSVEKPASNPGIGVFLLSKVHKITDFTGGVGGSADTHATVPRMGTRTVPDIAATLRRPLSLHTFLAHAEKKFPILPRLSATAIGRLPMPFRKRQADLPPSKVSSGVDTESLAPLFDRPADSQCRVRYDERHLAWLGRYPGAEFRSYSLASGSEAAVALAWREPRDGSRWRLAGRHSAGGSGIYDGLLADIMQDLRTQQASLVSAMLSSHDTDALAALKRSGFIEVGERYPLYISDIQGPDACAEGFADMSYLDTDFAFIS